MPGFIVENGRIFWFDRSFFAFAIIGSASEIQAIMNPTQLDSTGHHARVSLATLVALILVALMVFLFGLGGGYLFQKWMASPERPHLSDTATVVTEIQSLAQLVTVKFVLEKVVRLDDVKWYGENRLLMLAHGVAKAGVDLHKLRAEDVFIRGGTIHLTLPKPQLFDVYLDEHQTEVIERSTGVLRSFDQEMEQEARRQAVDEIRRAARAAGILHEAEERAREQLTVLARASGYTGVEITFR